MEHRTPTPETTDDGVDESGEAVIGVTWARKPRFTPNPPAPDGPRVCMYIYMHPVFLQQRKGPSQVNSAKEGSEEGEVVGEGS